MIHSSVGTNCSKLCTMVQFALCTTCCTSGCTILWKLCTIKHGQCTINNELCKIVACTTTCPITKNMQHLSTMQILYASLFILCKYCAWCSKQFSLAAKFCNCFIKWKIYAQLHNKQNKYCKWAIHSQMHNKQTHNIVYYGWLTARGFSSPAAHVCSCCPTYSNQQ